jgi:uncharacterized protein with HEPN domain
MKKFKELKKIHRKLRDNFDENFNIRIHRSLSWLEKSELEKDADANFIFLWISFNGTYSNQTNKYDIVIRSEFFNLIYKYGKDEIDKIIDKKFKDEIYDILDNEHLMTSYWDGPGYEFESTKEIEKEKAQNALSRSEKNSKITLEILFRRMSVLRNQIFHGYTTYNSKINKDSVKNASELMKKFIPLFIEIMMNNPSEAWGEIDFHPNGIYK